MSQEIEVKIKVSDQQLKLLKKYLQKNAEHKGEVHHEEYYLDNPKYPFTFVSDEGFKDADDYLRVRKTKDGDSICLKLWHKDPKRKGHHTHCDEYETDVENGDEMLKIFDSLGFTDFTLIDKTRSIYKTESFEIVIDEVKALGTFVEVELKKEVRDPRDGLKQILKFLKVIGLTKFKQYRRGYVSMVWNPEIDFGEEITI